MSNLIKRTVPVILVLVLCITCLVSPVSASSADSNDMCFWDILDYDSLDYVRGNQYTLVGDQSFTWSVPEYRALSYCDILCVIGGGNNDLKAYVETLSGDIELNLVSLGGNLYRLYGELPFRTHTNFTLKIKSSVQKSRSYSFYYVKVSTNQLTPYDMSGEVVATLPSGAVSATWDAGNSATLALAAPSSDLYSTDFYCNIYPYDWENYDYIYLTFYYKGDVPYSLIASIDGVSVPFSYDYLSFDDNETYRQICIKFDLTGISREPGASEVPLGLFFNSHYSGSSYVHIISCYGVLDIPEPSQFRILTDKLGSWFQTLFDKFDEAFGLNDDSASVAQQTQEEINVSVNNQLVGAVEDWNTNIEVVQTGYDSALTKATPALGWLASLADGVFSGMGWFGNIYFLVGLISVIMLVLSKSGLARSVSRFRRNE